VWALYLHGNPPQEDLLATYDLKIDALRACELISGADKADIAACPLVRRSPASQERPS